MPTVRRYDDPCGIARALDVIGDRWALLVVRELIFGAKRFAQVRSGLPGISPNVLSQRLRELEDAGLLRRDVLDPPANVTLYELTDRGRALEPILLELGRWGSREPVTTSTELSANALLLALKTVFDPDAAVDATFALRVDGEWFQVAVVDRSIDITRGRLEQADVTLEADLPTLRSVAFGRKTVAAAERAGQLTVAGDRRLAQRFARMFAVPAQPARGR
jgi:DNA-binding HxlR family transcriptional regulator/putative sterol carrier protein